MSHDRGCFECGRDRWNYEACAKENGPDKCVKYDLVFGPDYYRKEIKKMSDNLERIGKDTYERVITDHTPETRVYFKDNIIKLIQDTSYNQIEMELTHKQAIQLAEKILDRLMVKV